MAASASNVLSLRSSLSTLERVRALYGIDNWGAGYFRANSDGNLTVSPSRDEQAAIDLHEVVGRLAGQGTATPLLLRFPQILDERLATIHGAFANACAEFGYDAGHMGVYPLKVNQSAAVVQRLVESGRPYNYGLEVGSKAELVAALAQPMADEALLVCNGLKDDLFLRMALLAEKLGARPLLVVEDSQDLVRALDAADKLGLRPRLGARVKLYSRGSGKWEESGGEFAKFGMGSIELVATLKQLQQRGVTDAFEMLHFHIGSQITDIRRAKQAFREAARVYAKVCKMGFKVRYLNVGGGLGVDYDGSKTASEFSVNYSVQEFANDVIYSVGEVCDAEEIPPPVIVTESGRAMTAYHAVLITDVRKVIEPGGQGFYSMETIDSDAEPVRELLDTAREMHGKNFREYYHDALQQREDLIKLFELGYLGLDDKAQGEWLFWRICRQAVKYSRTLKQRPEEFEDLDKLLASKYICNFSMFQSLPDFWAFDQLFPVMPIHRLTEMPTERGVLCDITCDSDGSVDKFVDVKDAKESLELHRLRPGEPYYLATMLVGAYQETLGDLHNLFGVVTEASISVDSKGQVEISDVIPGDSVEDVLEYTDHRVTRVRQELEARLESAEDRQAFMDVVTEVLGDYTYLG